MSRFVCIHGHFYQPPRENPWLDFVEVEDSAHPFHDWNARITAECYAANARSRILDEAGRIAQLVNNYERISFNFGPTLLSWMERGAPEVYQAILEADRRALNRHGHGAALAQNYNHLIMPLANDRDRRTQVVWGIADFQYRFGRRPEGMWLAETAVDLPTLEALAEQGIRFTLLAPHQARRVRRLGTQAWQAVGPEGIDPRRPYLQRLASGREIVLFFYDGAISHEIAFGDLLRDGARLARRLAEGFGGAGEAELVHVATDGETYGHHHRFGDMALAFALEQLDTRPDLTLIPYAAFLAEHPPEYEVEIAEDTSWSCAHGIERWRADCGCSTGGHPEFHQRWRAPLRAAFDRLRDTLAAPFEAAGGALLRDPWAARDGYIEVVLRGDEAAVARFLEAHARRPLTERETVHVLELMEMQRHLLLMYTSCGWFFDDISRIETQQVLRYAGRAVELARRALDLDLGPQLREDLRAAESNVPRWGDGRRIYDHTVSAARVELGDLAAHYVVRAALPAAEPTRTEEARAIYAAEVRRQRWEEEAVGTARLVAGEIALRHRRTWEKDRYQVAALHLGDHALLAGARRLGDAEGGEVGAALAPARAALEAGRIPESVRRFEECFGGKTLDLSELRRDDRYRLLARAGRAAADAVEAAVEALHQQHAALLHFLHANAVPVPAPLRLAAALAVERELREALSQRPPDGEAVRHLAAEGRCWGVPLGRRALAHALQGTLEALARALLTCPDLAHLETLLEVLDLAESLPVHVDLWEVQNLAWEFLHGTGRGAAGREGDAARDAARRLASGVEGTAAPGTPGAVGPAKGWQARCADLADRLGLRPPDRAEAADEADGNAP
ncbi:MAG: DUF3536 domain-containing protein [Deltaproteobacteria bacterium]|nr:MAG: DUF3536 domain-containing protein [Deltaproteobacteria bacterium]